MFGQRLRLARKRAGLSMRSLADQVIPSISTQAISKYEAGKMLPSSSVLVELGRVLGVSLDFLMGAQVETVEALEFRKHSRASARDRDRAEAVLVSSLDRYLAIEEILGLPGYSDWSKGHRCRGVASGAEVDARADDLRMEWNLGLDPIPSLCALLEGKGIKVIEADLPTSINGLACRALGNGEPVAEAVMVSSAINVERKRFTLAHELAHRIIRPSDNHAVPPEAAMNRFAGAFLIPGERLIEEAGHGRHRITPYEVMWLKHTYGVSAACMLTRLGQVGVLERATVQRAFMTFARAWRKSEPEPIGPDEGFAFFERPRRFERLVMRSLGEELISSVRAAELLEESLDEVERRICGPLTE